MSTLGIATFSDGFFVVGVGRINEASQCADLYGVILQYRTRANGLCCRLERNAWRQDGEELIRQRDMERIVNDE